HHLACRHAQAWLEAPQGDERRFRTCRGLRANQDGPPPERRLTPAGSRRPFPSRLRQVMRSRPWIAAAVAITGILAWKAPPTTAARRYRLDLKTTQVIDLKAMGQTE